MTKSLNVLIVEDSRDDAELLAFALREAGFDLQWERVEIEADFLKQLSRKPDIIISDYSMPRFSGLRAAQLAKESGLDIPFILVSGTVGEEVAVEAMRHGATDYLLKDRIVRLGAAVDRALRDTKERAERKRLQEEIALREQRLNAFFSGATAGLVLLDKDMRYIQVSDTLAEMNGVPVKEHLGRTVAEVMPNLAPQVETLLQKVLTTGESILNVELSGETRREPGVQRYWTESFFPVLGKEGRPECVGAIVVETTERVRAEESLRASEQRFREIAENIREVFWVTDPAKHQVLYISPAYEAIWGRTCRSLYDSPLTWLHAVHPGDRDRISQAAVANPHGEDAVTYDEEYRIFRPDGTMRWIHDRAFPVRNAAGEVYRVVGVAEDITDRRKLEDQYRQAQKMEAIGQLAGGVAHDFNNVLAVIQMQCDLMQANGNLSPAQQEFTEDIAAAAQRAAALTRQLLLFSRKEVMQPRDVDLNQSIGSMTKMLRRILGEDVQVQFKFSLQPLLIRADPGMIDQVLMNLVVNSRDAMPKGGKLVLETSAAVLDEFAAAQSPNARPGSFVCLAVSDSGCGIPAENLSRIFEPFFTTKDVGKGTGLGLATVFGIIQQHQGWISAYSEVDHGTTFRIYLPRLDQAAAAESKSAALTPAAGGKEGILLVEDDPFVRSSLCAALTRLGYQVSTAANGSEALEVWKQVRNDIRLLLTDLVMPGGMTGRELAETLLRDDPKLKVLYASGYCAEVAAGDFQLEEGVNFLTKPFEAHKLAEMIRARLDR